ncbi:hypothetical protein CCYA_CCYA01G0320 [Cyanidiococcus yangmingshanensis]|nr:hypothetical protein CCYA_CCYA01G0320 [Cyanidiococcus yangmingshanensis]
MAKRPRPSSSQENFIDSEGPVDTNVLRYQIAQLGAALQARQEELRKLEERVETLERELALYDVAHKPELRPEWESLVQAAEAARKIQRLEEELEDARQQLTQQRRLLVRTEFGVSVTGVAAKAGKDIASSDGAVEAPTAQPAPVGATSEVPPASTALDSASESATTTTGLAESDKTLIAALQSQVNELTTRVTLLTEELEHERELYEAAQASLAKQATERTELAEALQAAKEHARCPPPETIRESAVYKSMEAHLLILLRAEQKWSQDREELIRERDELLVRVSREAAAENKELLGEIEKLKSKLSEKNAETERLKENIAKLQMMYEEKKKVAIDSAVLEETSKAVRQLQERNAELATKLQASCTAENHVSEDLTEYLAEIESLSTSITGAEATIAQLTERLTEKEAALGKVLAERLKYIQQQLTLKEQLKVESSRADKEHELVQQINQALTAARAQISELQNQMSKMADEMRIVRKQADIARLGAEKSSAEAFSQRQLAELAQQEMKRLSEELAQLRGQIEQLREALRVADEAKARIDRRATRLEHELALTHKRQGAAASGDADWQQEMIEELRRKLYCTVCKVQEKQVILVRCFHMFCRDCIQKNITNRNRKCPLCGDKFGTDDVKPIFFV